MGESKDSKVNLVKNKIELSIYTKTPLTGGFHDPGISVAFSREVIIQLNQIHDLMLASSQAYMLFAENFNKISDCLDQLGDIELTITAKNNIKTFLSRKFLNNLYSYIRVFDRDGYKFRASYAFEKILKKLDLMVNDKLSVSQKQAAYIIYELKNIIKCFDLVKEKYIEGQNYDCFFLVHFDEIDALLKKINVDELDVRYKEIIKNLKRNILLKSLEYRNFPFKIYNEFLLRITAVFIIPNDKKVSGSADLLKQLNGNKNHVGKELSKGPAADIIAALESIKVIIHEKEFNTKSANEKINDSRLIAYFYVIKDLLVGLKASELDKECINKILLDIRLILDQNQFDDFYTNGGDMAEIFSNLECAVQNNSIQDKKMKGSRSKSPLQEFSHFKVERSETSLSEDLGNSPANSDPMSLDGLPVAKITLPVG